MLKYKDSGEPYEGLQTFKNEWLRIFCALLTKESTVGEAAKRADVAVSEFAMRFGNDENSPHSN